jgi:uncharacterized RDD family membrane protein YckC
VESSELTCANCGAKAAITAQYCSECGKGLGGPEYAGFWIRLVANVFDGLILLIPNIILSFGVGGVTGFLLSLALGIVYTIGFWTAKGATPGKMVVGIEIVTVNEERIGFGKAFLRYIGYWVSTITLSIGYLMIAFSRQKRGLHDHIAGTIVVRSARIPTVKARVSFQQDMDQGSAAKEAPSEGVR